MESHKMMKIALFVGLLLSAYGSSRAFVFFDFDDFDDYFNNTFKRAARVWRDKAVSEESIELPEIAVEKAKDKQRVTLTIAGLKDTSADDIRTTYNGDNRVVVTFPYAKGKATLEVYPHGFNIGVEKEVTQTIEKKDASGKVIGTSHTRYVGYNSRSELFGFKIAVSSIKNADNQPQLEGENLILSFGAESAGERIAVKSVSARMKTEKKDDDAAHISTTAAHMRVGKKSEKKDAERARKYTSDVKKRTTDEDDDLLSGK